MKACIIQPEYSTDLSRSDELFLAKLKMLDECDESVDIIVLPEYSDIPCAAQTLEQTLYFHNKYIDALLKKCIDTAERCHASVFVNALSKEACGYRNTTYVFNKHGKLQGKYFKRHLPPFEAEVLKLDDSYTNEFSEPYVVELDGVRYGFLTCYDFYFYEAFASIARSNVDIIIGCSLQRSDTHSAIEIMCRFLAYNTNAYVVRSSVSFNEKSTVCGASMIVAPDGAVLANMRGRIGMEIREFDPKSKYYKSAGYGNPPAAHHEYIEYGRKPFQYRACGASVVQSETRLPYPRVCISARESVSDDKRLATFGAAAALGIDEILISVFELGTALFERILQRLGSRVIMNIELPRSSDNFEALLLDCLGLLYKYDAAGHAYFTVYDEFAIKKTKECAPSIPVCFAAGNGSTAFDLERAVGCGAKKILLSEDLVTEEVIKALHLKNIKCLAVCRNCTEAGRLSEIGIDTQIKNGIDLMPQGELK